MNEIFFDGDSTYFREELAQETVVVMALFYQKVGQIYFQLIVLLMNQFDNAPFDLFDKLLPLVFQQFKSDRLQFALQSDFLLVFQRLFQPDFS